jgi:hypothetical protein
VAARAKANGVGVWALTDHDEVGGVARARAAARRWAWNMWAGVEISVTWAGQTVHIVGLRIDETNRRWSTDWPPPATAANAAPARSPRRWTGTASAVRMKVR